MNVSGEVKLKILNPFTVTLVYARCFQADLLKSHVIFFSFLENRGFGRKLKIFNCEISSNVSRAECEALAQV